MKAADVSIVIPTYNERGNIVPLIKEIKSVLSGRSYEIIVVDDRSEDGTFEAVQRSFGGDEGVKCLLRRGERDLGKSILEGVRRSTGGRIIGMDADFNHDPKILPILMERSGDCDIVVASRFVKGGGMQDPAAYFFSYGFNMLIRRLFKFPIFDNTSGYYIIKRESLMAIGPENAYYGYGEYHLRLVYFAHRLNMSIKEIPVIYGARKTGASKSKRLEMFFSYFRAAYALSRQRRKAGE